MNHSWRADVIQEVMLLALDSEVGSQPKATNTPHLLSDSWNLLLFSLKLSLEELPVLQNAVALHFGNCSHPSGASKRVWTWQERENFHNLVLVFPKEINLEYWGTSNSEGKVFLAQYGNQECLYKLSKSEDQTCFLVFGMMILINADPSPELPFQEEPKYTRCHNYFPSLPPTCSWWSQ